MKPLRGRTPVWKMIVDLDLATDHAVPERSRFEAWVAAVPFDHPEMALSIRMVDEAEARLLNETYRQKPYATNILSFPCEVPEGIPNPVLGDLVICVQVVEREALEQGKSIEAHYAHLVVHGILHLQGYDHLEAEEALCMEAMEINILAQLGYPNPYEDEIDSL